MRARGGGARGGWTVAGGVDGQEEAPVALGEDGARGAGREAVLVAADVVEAREQVVAGYRSGLVGRHGWVGGVWGEWSEGL